MASSNSEPWKDVAVKQFRPNVLDLQGKCAIRTYDDLERYCAEIKILLHLRQGTPDTCTVLYLYEYFLNGRDVYVVTELLDQDLNVWRQQCQEFTEQMAIDIGRSILCSLKFISENNVVHRDIKLQNVLFRSSGDFKSLKLVDFGLSCILGANEHKRDFCGSIGYLAPEVYAGTSYRFEVDMFSFGVLLFRLLSSERPFLNHNLKVLRQHTLDFRYNVDGPAWKNVSNTAKDLIRSLLVHRDERLTANEALAHPWFQNQIQQELEGKNLLDIDCRVGFYKRSARIESPRVQQSDKKNASSRSLQVSRKLSENFKSGSFQNPTWINFYRDDANAGHSLLTSINSLFQN